MPRDPLRRAAGRVPRASPQLFCEKDLLWLLGKSVPLVEAVCRNGPLGQKNDLRDAPFPDQLLHLGQELGAEAASLPLRLDAELLDPILRARAPVFDAPQGDADEAACLIESPGERAAAGERSRTYRQSCSSDQTSFQGSPEKNLQNQSPDLRGLRGGQRFHFHGDSSLHECLSGKPDCPEVSGRTPLILPDLGETVYPLAGKRFTHSAGRRWD